MNSVLAIVIDDTVVNWVIGVLSVIVPTVGTTIVVLWRKLIAFMKPKVESAFDAHTGLVRELKTQVPMVAETLRKLGDTQDQQCKTLEQHGKILEGHHTKIDEILTAVRKGKPHINQAEQQK